MHSRVAIVLLAVLLGMAGAMHVANPADPHSEQTTATSHLPPPYEGSATDQRVTPDYLNGPWFLLPDEHPFDAFTDRPRIVEALKLLRSVVATVNQGTNATVHAREGHRPEEEALIAEGKEMAAELQAELDKLTDQGKAFGDIAPTQDQIMQKTKEDLASALMKASELHQIDSEIRFPFADRLATFTEDLQKVLRAKEDASCRLRDYMPAAEFKDMLKQYDDIASKIREKIDAEVKAASDVLNPNTASLHDTQATLEQVESELKELRARLKTLIETGEGYLPHEEHVTKLALDDESALVDSLERAGNAQDGMIQHIKAVEGEQLSVVRHTASILGALLVPDPETVKTQDAHEPPVATQRVRQD